MDNEDDKYFQEMDPKTLEEFQNEVESLIAETPQDDPNYKMVLEKLYSIRNRLLKAQITRSTPNKNRFRDIKE